VSWDRLIGFAELEAPSFVASLVGVPLDEIAAIEHQYDVRLPANYKQFLLLMGAESGGFHLFGPNQNQRFRDVVAQLPDESSPVQEYFKIAFAGDDSRVNPPDHFLDLTRSDGIDAPIVMFESGGEFNREEVQEKGFTFLEQTYRRLFAFLAEQRLLQPAMVAVPTDEHSFTTIVSDLANMNFEVVLPSLPRVSCLRRPGLWAVASVHVAGRGVALNFWSDDARALSVVVDQLLVRFPAATYRARSSPLGA
jgi:SMI1 / KNR4 family (SUKH-1)